MSERKPIKVQFVIPYGEADQFEQLREDLGLTKGTDVFRQALDALHFLVEEAKRGAEIFSHRPDGTYGTTMLRSVDRVRRKAVEQSEEKK